MEQIKMMSSLVEVSMSQRFGGTLYRHATRALSKVLSHLMSSDDRRSLSEHFEVIVLRI